MIDSYPLEWEAFLQKLHVMDWERLIPGHPGVQRPARHQAGRAEPPHAHAGRIGRGQGAGAQGKCWEPVEKEMQLPKYASWPGYANGLPFVLRRYCGLWGRGT